MSLRRIKTLYCLAVIAIGLILTQAGAVGYIAAVLVLGGALPGWKLAIGMAEQHGETQGAQRTLLRIQDRLNADASGAGFPQEDRQRLIAVADEERRARFRWFA